MEWKMDGEQVATASRPPRHEEQVPRALSMSPSLPLHSPLRGTDRPVRARVGRALLLVPFVLLHALVEHVVVRVAVAGLVGGGEAGVVGGGLDLWGRERG